MPVETRATAARSGFFRTIFTGIDRVFCSFEQLIRIVIIAVDIVSRDQEIGNPWDA